jgi:DNA-binding MarR family transcriptional regulator
VTEDLYDSSNDPVNQSIPDRDHPERWYLYDVSRNQRVSPEALEVWERVLRYHHRTLLELDRELFERCSLRLEEYDVLYQLSVNDGTLRMRELAERVLVTNTSCTRLVDRLVQRGLVERHSSITDRRSVVVRASSTGRAVLRRASPIHGAGIARVFGSLLSSESVATLSAILDELERPLRTEGA